MKNIHICSASYFIISTKSKSHIRICFRTSLMEPQSPQCLHRKMFVFRWLKVPWSGSRTHCPMVRLSIVSKEFHTLNHQLTICDLRFVFIYCEQISFFKPNRSPQIVTGSNGHISRAAAWLHRRTKCFLSKGHVNGPNGWLRRLPFPERVHTDTRWPGNYSARSIARNAMDSWWRLYVRQWQ